MKLTTRGRRVSFLSSIGCMHFISVSEWTMLAHCLGDRVSALSCCSIGPLTGYRPLTRCTLHAGGYIFQIQPSSKSAAVWVSLLLALPISGKIDKKCTDAPLQCWMESHGELFFNIPHAQMWCHFFAIQNNNVHSIRPFLPALPDVTIEQLGPAPVIVVLNNVLIFIKPTFISIVHSFYKLGCSEVWVYLPSGIARSIDRFVLMLASNALVAVHFRWPITHRSGGSSFTTNYWRVIRKIALCSCVPRFDNRKGYPPIHPQTFTAQLCRWRTGRLHRLQHFNGIVMLCCISLAVR